MAKAKDGEGDGLMAGPRRLERGGALIDRAKPVAFFAHGRSHLGFEGDTLASALLAAGLADTPPSPRYARPRALMSGAGDEPNALFRIADRRGVEASRPAPLVPLRPAMRVEAPGAPWSQSRARRFLTPILGAGAPRSAPETQAETAQEALHFFADLLVIGGGVAGIAAAKAAVASGARVLLIDRAAHWGGAALHQGEKIGRGKAKSWVDQEIAKLQAAPEATLRLGVEALSLADPSGALLLERPAAPGPLRRLWRVCAKRVVLATGATERGILFAENDLPGVMGADAMRRYLANYGVLCGGRIAIFTNNDSGHRAALELAEAGAEIAAVVDPRPNPKGAAPRLAAERGLPQRLGAVVCRAVANRKSGRIEAVEIAAMRGSGRLGPAEILSCDALGVSGGWSPQSRLWREAGAAWAWDAKRRIIRPCADAEAQTPSGAPLCAIGAAIGAESLEETLSQGVAAGRAAGKACAGSAARLSVPKTAEENCGAASSLLIVPGRGDLDGGERHFVDPAADLTLADVERAARGGARSLEALAKAVGLKAPLGAGAESLAAAAIADELCAPLEAPAGDEQERRLPEATALAFLRQTPMQGWHAANGAVFEEASFEETSVWRAPQVFLRQSGPDGEMEDHEEATIREVRLARRGVALHDASSLQKILVEGPQAKAALNDMLASPLDDLPPGRCRVELLTAADGAALAEATIAGLEAEAFLLQAPAQTAEAALARLAAATEGRAAWHADLTDAYAQIALYGPKARLLLERLSDQDFSEAAMPSLSWTDLRLAGREARLFRLAEPGGVGFEISVPAAYGADFWDIVIEAGVPLGAQPLGAAARDILRIERGRPAPGREADGVARPEALRPAGDAGLRLVGLEPEDRETPPSVGAVLRAGDSAGFFGMGRGARAPAIGRVTSSCWSPTLERAIALALVDGDRRQTHLGAVCHAVDDEGRQMRMRIAKPRFVDPGAQNIDGWRPL